MPNTSSAPPHRPSLPLRSPDRGGTACACGCLAVNSGSRFASGARDHFKGGFRKGFVVLLPGPGGSLSIVPVEALRDLLIVKKSGGQAGSSINNSGGK